MSRRRLTVLATLALAGVVPVSNVGASSDASITFWTSDIEPDRVANQQAIIDAFTAETGIEVELVPVPEDDLPNLIVTNAASGDLPDVVQTPLDYSIGWAEQGIIDPEAAAEVIEMLGTETFNQQALALASQDGVPVAVPADGWGMLTLYRTDLFEAAGLEAPQTLDDIVAAAEALHQDGMNGITMSTDPAGSFTQQTFEYLALANGCQLEIDGEIALDSPECVDTIAKYQQLVQFSPGTVQDVDTTRATYFAGEAAMILWSPFILDEMAGLRDDTLPTCAECADDPLFIANNTGLVAALSGGEGTEPAQYGVVTYLGIGAGADVEAAQQFIAYVLSDGYLDHLGVAPEGRFPMRTGTAEEPNKFVEGWAELPFGVDTRVPFSDIYGPEIVETLINGTADFRRWGFEGGYGALVSSVYTSLIVPQTLSQVLNEGMSPEDAAAQLQADVEQQLADLG
jgi:multiple sugar transport system substrate-binding protein